MMRHLVKVLSVISGVLLYDADGSHAALLTIVSDSFLGSNGAAVNGRTPDGANLPGGNWYSVGTGFMGDNNNPFGAAPVINGNTALMTVNSSAFISLQSFGGYVKPTQFTISGDLKVGTISGNNLGAGMGFNDVNNQFEVSQEISLGINGDLNFKQVLIASYNAANFGGNAFNPNNFYHLSYTVNTGTGGVSNITLSNTLGSQSYTLSTAAFTNAETNYAGIFTNSSTVGKNGNIDNFLIVTEIPEPASIPLIALTSLLALRRRHA